jgi:peroxiredoxin-like protein
MKNQNDEHSYKVIVEWTGESRGKMSSPGIDEQLQIATPPEFPGGVEGVWSPEHLYTASVASCFMTSFTAIARYSNFEFIDLKIDSDGIMSKEENKFVMSKVILIPVLTISRDVSEKKALRLLEKAEEICLITRSVKTEVQMEPQVRVSEMAS